MTVFSFFYELLVTYFANDFYVKDNWYWIFHLAKWWVSLQQNN